MSAVFVGAQKSLGTVRTKEVPPLLLLQIQKDKISYAGYKDVLCLLDIHLRDIKPQSTRKHVFNTWMHKDIYICYFSSLLLITHSILVS